MASILDEVKPSKVQIKKMQDFIANIFNAGPIAHFEVGHMKHLRAMMRESRITPSARAMRAIYEYLYEKSGKGYLQQLVKYTFCNSYSSNAIFENSDDGMKEFIGNEECILSKEVLVTFISVNNGKKTKKKINVDEVKLSTMYSSMAKRILKAMDWKEKGTGRRPAYELLQLAEKFERAQLEYVAENGKMRIRSTRPSYGRRRRFR